MVSTRSIVLPILGCLGCSSEPTPSGHPVQLGEEQICSESNSAEALVYQEEAAARGIVRRESQSPSVEGTLPLDVGLAVTDADGDRDLDLVVAVRGEFPQLFENDGAGGFSEKMRVEREGEALMLAGVTGFFLQDWNGDALADLVFLGPRSVSVSLNQGQMSFGKIQAVFTDSSPKVGVPISAVQADLDADGDLDLFLPSLDPMGSDTLSEIGQEGSVDRILERRADRYVLGDELQGENGPGIAMVGLATDQDDDKDLDLLVPSLRGAFGMAPTAFYRNPTLGSSDEEWSDQAASLSADLPISGMGADSFDVNGDGRWDYCFSDLNRIQCLLSGSDGGYSEGAQAIGMSPITLESGKGWSGWSLEAADLDNDGYPEIAVVAGMPLNQVGDNLDYSGGRDRIWRGHEAGFELDESTSFSSTSEHYGLVAADLDLDGSLELVTTGPNQELELHRKPCNDGHWVRVSLAGPPGNTAGLGASIALETENGVQVRELHGVRGFAQGPAAAHFGLGDADEVHRMVVSWPDGVSTASVDLPVNRTIHVPHPSRIVGGGDTAELWDSADDTSPPELLAQLFGEVTRSASLAGDGIGELVVMVFEDNPMQNASTPPVAWATLEADFSMEGARWPFDLEAVPVRQEPYSVIVFLDDDQSGITTGPNSGDLAAMEAVMTFPEVLLDEARAYEVDFDLNVVIP